MNIPYTLKEEENQKDVITVVPNELKKDSKYDLKNETSVKVVIAHYNEDLEWVKNLKYPSKIISKNNIPLDVSPNKGNEASSYLQYIIECYDNLDDYTIFLHGHRTSNHSFGNTDEYVNELQLTKDYYNFNKSGLHILIHYPDFCRLFNSQIDILNKILKSDIKLTDICFKGNAQFYVSKNLILRNPKQVYIDLHNYLQTSEIESYYTGRFLESLWHFIFTGNIVDNP